MQQARILLMVGLLTLAGGLAGPVATPLTASPPLRARALFPIVEHGRWGFMDSAGAVVIAPRFIQVQAFTGGLVAAREAGRYGYLNQAGGWALPPAYDYATAFRQGLAAVAPDSLPQLVDATGHLVALPARYLGLAWLPGRDRGGLWAGTLPGHDQQLLDARGHLLSPVRLTRVGELSNNRIVVERQARRVAGTDTLNREQTAVFNGRGHLVIRFGRFDRVSTFWENVAMADLAQAEADETPPQQCLIDTTGRVLARLPRSQSFVYNEQAEVSEGAIPVQLGRAGKAPDLNNADLGAVDRRGRLLFRRADLRMLSAFHRGRAWAENRRHAWFLLNQAGQRVGSAFVSRPLGLRGPAGAPQFAAGAELVELANGAGYVALDRAGHVVARLAAPKFAFNDAHQVGELLIFHAADTTDRLGFWNWRGGLLVPPRFAEISAEGYQHGLLAVVEDNRLGYLSPAGYYVWRAAPARTSEPLNLDYMRRAFYSVASVPLPRYAGFGGWATSGNQAQPVAKTPGAEPALSLRVAVAAAAGAFEPDHDGHHVTLTNATADTVVFDAQDSSLYLTVQAQDAQSQWRDIEFTPGSWCGNSYHQVFLAPGQGWQLTVPAYTGERPTRLRLRLRSKSRRQKGEQVMYVYSNEFAGAVNPAQFWRRPGHSPQGIMDPYAE